MWGSEIRINGEKTGANTNYFAYDKLNRLNNSWNTLLPTMNETNISYDKGGNILHLERGNNTNMNYDYTGNFLNRITGTQKGIGIDKYYYEDYNGNTHYFEDNNGGTDPKYIYYDHNNLPVYMTGSSEAYHLYDANGVKLYSHIFGLYSEDYTVYAGSVVFKNYENNISFLSTEEGRAVRNPNGSYRYEYFIKDHLGNVRQSIDKNNGVARVIQEDNYCAFGLSVNKYNFSSDNKYLYNGKEKVFIEDLQDYSYSNLEWYDYGARFYDPVVGRWNVVDPLAEKSRRFSPYVYGNNNPIRFIDPDGMQARDWVKWTSSSGQSHITYDPEVKTVEQAQAKGYTNVNQVFEAGTGIAMNSGEVFGFRSDGTVSINGGKPIDLADGGYQTENGTFLNRNSTTTEQTASALQAGGDGITALGIVTGQPEIVAVGELISGIGLGVELINNFTTNGVNAGTSSTAAIKIGLNFGFGKLGDAAVSATRTVAGSAAVGAGSNVVSESIMQGTTMTTSKITEYVIDETRKK